MKLYKFRAECESDVDIYLDNLDDNANLHTKIQMDKDFPDLEVVIGSELTIDQLRNCSISIEDNHVISQTIQPIENYTGKRDYSIQ